MIIEQASVWDYLGIADAIFIPTNGFTKNDGAAVMGRGVAKQAQEMFPGIEYKLGKRLDGELKTHGNEVHKLLVEDGTGIYSFPVKPRKLIIEGFEDLEKLLPRYRKKYKVKGCAPGYQCKADLLLIKKSAERVKKLAKNGAWSIVVLPKVGCGNGGLKWPIVQKLLEEILDDEIFIIADFEGK